MTLDADERRVFQPALPDSYRHQLLALVAAGLEAPEDQVRLLRAGARDGSGPERMAYRTACLVLADLAENGWTIGLTDGEPRKITIDAPNQEPIEGESLDDVRRRLRASMLVARNRQLAEPATRDFLRKMERSTPTAGGRGSVFDLVDDGTALATELERAIANRDSSLEEALGRIIRPTVEVCEVGAVCRFTNLPLPEIWRYLRHTWSLEYRSTPGRTLALLIRNAARPKAPIIGIAMLASPAMRLSARDTWMGWYPDELQRRVFDGSWDAASTGRALLAALDRAISEIRSDDLLDASEVENPSETFVLRLEQRADGANKQRDAELKRARSESRVGATSLDRQVALTSDGTKDWRGASERLLFLAKRAGTLAKLLRARINFEEAELANDPARGIRTLLLHERGRSAIGTALTEIRKAALASQVADVNVCGAIAPYNQLLGGKLVALLLASQEVRDAYARRYGQQESEIASRLAGRSVTRSADLTLLTTTSLYGLSSNQYTRLHLLQSQHPELAVDVRWRRLGMTSGFGTVHLSQATVEALRELSAAEYGARRVNYVFGEGQSPRLRQVREGLESLQVHSDWILNHATQRVVYACDLMPAARERLLGIVTDPAPASSTVEAIATAWRRRWLTKRVVREEVFDRLRSLGPATVKAQLAGEHQGQLTLPFDTTFEA